MMAVHARAYRIIISDFYFQYRHFSLEEWKSDEIESQMYAAHTVAATAWYLAKTKCVCVCVMFPNDSFRTMFYGNALTLIANSHCVLFHFGSLAVFAAFPTLFPK